MPKINKMQRPVLFKRILDITNQAGFVGILYIYRYMSWLITSVFYLIMNPDEPFLLKTGVVLTLLFAAKTITDLYIKFSNSMAILEVAILTETVGITLLLIPTGGIESPFIWYALNPVLVAASYLPFYFCWVNLTIFLVCETLISYGFFQHSSTIGELLNENAYLFLVFILITLIVQMLSRLTKKLDHHSRTLELQSEELNRTNEALLRTNQMYKQSINHIMSLYQAVEAFSSQDTLENLQVIFAEYARKLTGAEASFFWMAPYKESKSTIAVCNMEGDKQKNQIKKIIETMVIPSGKSGAFFEIPFNESRFLCAMVESPSQQYGIIGIQINEERDDSPVDNTPMRQLSFLADLCAIVLERYHLEEIADRFLIIEEQNRIANEIHDSVSQRLYSIVCCIVVLTSKYKSDINGELGKQLELIRDTATQAIKELRASIYQLSSKKRKEKSFSRTLQEYLESFSKLNGVSLELNISGDENMLSSRMRKILYRIIRETTGNAVRHGECSKLGVHINVKSNNVRLRIKDNGKGFSVAKTMEEPNQGLGLYNVKSLIESLNGRMLINSRTDEGTVIDISIPLYSYDLRKGDVAYEGHDC